MINQTEEINGIIYCYFNRKKFKQEGIKKYYVGQTTLSIEARAGKNGANYLKKKRGKFCEAIKKWGWDAFEPITLEENIKSKEELNKLEQYYIIQLDSVDNGYNRLGGGEGFTYTCKCNKILIGTERCPVCGESLFDTLTFKCKKCGKILSGPTSRCTCGFCVLDTANYICKMCGKHLTNPSQRCSCGWCLVDETEYKCKKCGTKLSAPNQRYPNPDCGYCLFDDFEYHCEQCGTKIKSHLSRCPNCNTLVDRKYKCKNCGNEIQSPSSLCTKCGYQISKQYECKKCHSPINSANSKCPNCGYMTKQKFTCPLCGTELTGKNQKCPNPSCNYQYKSGFFCTECGKELSGKYATCSCGKKHQPTYLCKNCGGIITSPNSVCHNCNIIKAGYDNWKDYDPTYKILLDNEILIQDIYMNCVYYLMDLLNINEGKAKGVIKKDVYVSKNKTKYNQLKFQKIQ